jgi:hypothetical protein
MHAFQPQLPLALAQRPRARSVRRPFHPSQGAGPYKLPNAVRDRLSASLASFRNREAAFTLATFLGRFWSTPSRIVDAFPIDRRELADREDLGLSERQVRSAIRVLEEVGFLDRAIASGSRYKATEDGLRRKPILFMFGSDYAPAFIVANRRAAAARGGDLLSRRAIAPSQPSRASTGLPEARRPAQATRAAAHRSPSEPSLKCPKSKSEAESPVLMGQIRESGIPPKAFEPNANLEAALDRLLRGIRLSRG